jgi:hypothetical protein
VCSSDLSPSIETQENLEAPKASTKNRIEVCAPTIRKNPGQARKTPREAYRQAF